MTTYILINGVVRSIKEGRDAAAAIARLRGKGYTVQTCKKPPTLATMAKWNQEGIARSTDGCKVEPDGTCVHGCKSWMLVFGII